MKIKFLSKIEAKEYFKDLDEYGLALPQSNLDSMKVASTSEYHQILLDSFQDFTDTDKSSYTEALSPVKFLNIEIGLIKTSGSHALDIIQTRKKAILVPQNTFPSKPLFVHEVFHILSRNYDLSSLYSLLGFNPCRPQIINDPNFLLNPDCVLVDQSIEVLVSGESKTVVPYLSKGFGIGLKEVGLENYYSLSDTNYKSLFKNTSYLTHPEEICAELFALSLTGSCIFQKELDNKTLSLFNNQMKYLITKNKLLKDSYE